MGTNLTQALDSTHPSYGCTSAVFQFAMTDHVGRVVRFLLVEARNVEAVICIERILMMDGGKVAPNCRVICILRNCTSVGTRDDLMNEVLYVDFMQDIVRPELILNDTVTAACFAQSLSTEEREYAKSKAEALGQEPLPMEADVVEVVPAPAPAVVKVQKKAVSKPKKNSDASMQKLESSLCGLGFKKGDVQKFIDDLGDSAKSKPLQDLIRDGIVNLSA